MYLKYYCVILLTFLYGAASTCYQEEISLETVNVEYLACITENLIAHFKLCISIAENIKFDTGVETYAHYYNALAIPFKSTRGLWKSIFAGKIQELSGYNAPSNLTGLIPYINVIQYFLCEVGDMKTIITHEDSIEKCMIYNCKKLVELDIMLKHINIKRKKRCCVLL